MTSLAAIQLPFDQVVQSQDLMVVGLLVVLEGVLSIDNALVLGLLAKKLPKYLQGRALTYGLVGAFVFRLISIATASLLLRWWFVKFLGGAYLVYIAIKHLFFDKEEPGAHEIKVDSHGHPVLPDLPADGTAPDEVLSTNSSPRKAHFRAFWSTVVVIELTDIAFAIDSILAAIALVAGGHIPEHGFHPKLWVIVTGGFLGVILMRFAAIIFIRLLERFPRFETAAYLLVAVIGGKLLVDWYFNKKPDAWPAAEEFHPPVDFHSTHSLAFWIFWILMILCLSIGFLPPKKQAPAATGKIDPAQDRIA